MLMPKRVKYRKQHRGRRTGMALRGNYVAFGDFGLMSLEDAWISSRQIEAARRAITNYVRRGGKVWIRIFPDKPFTQKPAETRMGSGKARRNTGSRRSSRGACSTSSPASARMSPAPP